MSTPQSSPLAGPRVRYLLLLLILVVAAGALFLLRLMLLPAASLAETAQRGTWQAPAELDPLDTPQGYRESDFLAIDGKYYLFATGSEDPAWVDVYVARTPEELVNSAPLFTQVAPIRYPTVVKIGDTWHMWGVNPAHRWTEHWISHNPDPIDFVYSDSPFKGTSALPGVDHALRQAPTTGYAGASALPVVDFAVRQAPATGAWYGVGFETEDNAPLLLTRAPSPYGPWEKLNYVPKALTGGIFGDSGPPPWATAARFDPNLVFTPDGRAWTLFTGRATIPSPSPTALDQSGIVEVDVVTGKAIGPAIVLFDPRDHPDLPFQLASDLNFISVAGQPDRLLGYTDNPNAPLAVLDMPSLNSHAPYDGGD